MCGSMVDIQSPTAEIRRGKKKKKKKERNYRMKIYMVSLLHRAAIRRRNYRIKLEMWANAQPDGRPAEHRWRPLFNAAKFG